MRERDIEKHLVKRVKAAGGEVRKVVWQGRSGAPDRLVMFRDWMCWVELKAPGKKPRMNQILEHVRLRNMGQHVLVIDSIEAVEELLT